MNKLLFLTSTVSPSNISFAGSMSQRRDEYVKAIRFYLEETNCPILIVDNSGYDFKRDFPNEERLECLAYQASDHSSRGKGYGELSLIKYGFEHSCLIEHANQIVKITGRHIVKNINALLDSCKQEKAVYADVDVHLRFAMSYFFVAPKEFYIEKLFPNVELLDDKGHFFFEHLLASMLKQWLQKGNNFHEFRKPIFLVGHPGASSIAYKKPGWQRKFMIRLKYIIRELMNNKEFIANKYGR